MLDWSDSENEQRLYHSPHDTIEESANLLQEIESTEFCYFNNERAQNMQIAKSIRSFRHSFPGHFCPTKTTHTRLPERKR